MPPVLGPASPSPTRLKSWAAASGTARVPSHTANTESSGPVRPSSMTTLRPASPNAGPEQVVADGVAGLGQRLGDEHALAGGQPVGLDDVGPGSVVEEVERRLDLGEGAVRAPWARRRRPAAPSSTPSSPRAGRRRRPGRTRACPAARRRSASPSTSGCSGPTTNRSASISSAGVGDRAGDAGVARRDDDLAPCGQHVGQRVLAPTAARRRRPSRAHPTDSSGPTSGCELDVLVAARADADEA